jgi:hypothetical protein
VTSRQLRESLEHLRAYAAEVHEAIASTGIFPIAGALSKQPPLPPPPTPLDFAASIVQRVRQVREQAKILRRRAADLRTQAAECRAGSENARASSGRFE